MIILFHLLINVLQPLIRVHFLYSCEAGLTRPLGQTACYNTSQYAAGTLGFRSSHENQARCRAINGWQLLVMVSEDSPGPSGNAKDNGRLRPKDSLPCETIPPSPFHLSMSTEMAPIGHQHNSCDHFAIPLTLYWLRTRSTVVSFGSNLKTCFKSAGPRTASSRAQSISKDPHTSGRLGA